MSASESKLMEDQCISAEDSEDIKRCAGLSTFMRAVYVHSWSCIIESLIEVGGDRHVQAFNKMLEEGLGVTPWTVAGTMSLPELVRCSNGSQVAPSWAKPLSELR
jgi:hypothetical protein